jgi:NAD(P)-dependent dehydrogenase (short-subunit alcohol dehydrogenase family)
MLDQEPVDGERGAIVTLASIEGLEGTAGGSAYNASKGGVVLLTKNVAIDYGARASGPTPFARASSRRR